METRSRDSAVVRFCVVTSSQSALTEVSVHDLNDRSAARMNHMLSIVIAPVPAVLWARDMCQGRVSLVLAAFKPDCNLLTDALLPLAETASFEA